MSGEDNRVYGIYSGSELTIVPTQPGVPSAVSDAKYMVGENVNIRRESFSMLLVTGRFFAGRSPSARHEYHEYQERGSERGCPYKGRAGV
jgi:hypothetical protein